MNRNPRQTVWHFLAAAILYIVFAVYLYQPRFAKFAGWQWFLPANACIAAIGAYILSRRWVPGFAGALLAGLVYGFGPFLLGTVKIHPIAGLLAACVPWLFIPAALLEKRSSKATNTMLLLIPFAAIILFCYLSAGRRVFVAPLHVNIRPTDLVGFIAPLALIRRSTALLGLYHIPMAALVLGVAMTYKTRRYSIFAILIAGFVLAFSRSFLNAHIIARLGVSPILWLSIPMTWCAILAGIGLHGLIGAGYSNRKWVLAAVIVLGGLSILALLLAAKCFQIFLGLGDSYGRLFVEAAKIYLLGAAAIAVIYILAHMKLRIPWLRWAILITALSADIFFGARYIVDRLL